MRIGYSHWGFLGDGVTDTPDGGRSHRKTLVDGLVATGHDIVFLQADRDTTEARTPVVGPYVWDEGLPEVDALFLEWRWPVRGRNDTPCQAAGHTCDLHRQQQLVDHYVHRLGVPALLWDKDQRLAPADPIRAASHVTVCEPALYPRHGARSLLFPVADQVLDMADPKALADGDRRLPLVYVGNQYGRDAAFDAFFAPAAHSLEHEVAGKWTDTGRWPHVRFTGRISFQEGLALHHQSHATVLLAPDRYVTSGQFTQRVFEAVLSGCAPVIPAHYRGAATVVPGELHACGGAHVADITHGVAGMAVGGKTRLLDRCLRRLDVFRLSRQINTINAVLDQFGRVDDGS
ncbi:hypothetical protein [Streptomyces sp. ISL-94]|uniref:hypothetical protein n=1 Tax=Streptomyces sp. ISL-94 TaxID=2819190 RepID=UPI001BE97D4E|nr:hypothetical protein [Streptomyces sp. ISL-94]MBT2478369.1 hypothetical protein [Streptomyces sp. ISL-94]